MPTVEFTRAEQRRCAEQYHDSGARLGMNDWFCEEFLMEQDNHMLATGPDHPFYQTEPEERTEMIPLDLDFLLKMAAWSVEQPDVMWVFLNEYIESGHTAGQKWEMVDGTPTSGGVRITVRRKT